MDICISFEWGRLFKITIEETTKEKRNISERTNKFKKKLGKEKCTPQGGLGCSVYIHSPPRCWGGKLLIRSDSPKGSESLIPWNTFSEFLESDNFNLFLLLPQTYGWKLVLQLIAHLSHYLIFLFKNFKICFCNPYIISDKFISVVISDKFNFLHEHIP